MAARTSLHCRILTPERQVYDGDCLSVILPAHDGLVGVLNGRSPLVCELGPGIVRIRESGGELRWALDGGFAEVARNVVTLLTTRAAAPAELERGSAEAALSAAQQMRVTDDASFEARQRAVARARAELSLLS
jgi:F-type H+-transporting ATPase subunit epsilon